MFYSFFSPSAIIWKLPTLNSVTINNTMPSSKCDSNASRRDDVACHDTSLSRSSDSGQVPRPSLFLARPLPVAIPQALIRRRTEICIRESETLFKNGKISGSSESQNLQPRTTLDIIDEVLALLDIDVDELLMTSDLPLKWTRHLEILPNPARESFKPVVRLLNDVDQLFPIVFLYTPSRDGREWATGSPRSAFRKSQHCTKVNTSTFHIMLNCH